MFTLNVILLNTGTNIIIGVVIFILLWLLFYFVPIGLWFTALLSGVRINLLQLVLMRWRKVPPKVIVNSMITATKAGLQLTRDQLEAHYLAGGRVNSVVKALISADKANIPLDFKSAAAIDLAGRDVFEAVQMSVNPKVITTPAI
ncbi:MAG: flotillin-like FloA family protein, partial [Bacteroidales bacterium]